MSSDFLQSRVRQRENLLILQGTLKEPSDREIKQLKTLAGAVANWGYVLNTAYRNGVLSLVAHNLRKYCADDIPANVASEFAEFSFENTRKNLYLTKKLLEITALFESRKISILPFKGPVLAIYAYGNAVFRQFVDLDFLVKPADFERAAKLLRENGFLDFGAQVKWTEKNGLVINRKKDAGFLSIDGKIRVELHWKLSGSHFSINFGNDELWQRAEKITIGRQAVLSFGFTDLFVYLCVHGSRHGFERLEWLCDLREVLRARSASGEEIDWTEIINRAKSVGCLRTVEFSVFLLRYFFGFETAYPRFKKIETDVFFKHYAAQIRDNIFSEDFKMTDISAWHEYHAMLREKSFDRFKLHLYYFSRYFRLTFKPNEKDQHFFQLPAYFSPIYFLLRPLRLFFIRINSETAKK